MNMSESDLLVEVESMVAAGREDDRRLSTAQQVSTACHCSGRYTCLPQMYYSTRRNLGLMGQVSVRSRRS